MISSTAFFLVFPQACMHILMSVFIFRKSGPLRPPKPKTPQLEAPALIPPPFEPIPSVEPIFLIDPPPTRSNPRIAPLPAYLEPSFAYNASTTRDFVPEKVITVLDLFFTLALPAAFFSVVLVLAVRRLCSAAANRASKATEAAILPALHIVSNPAALDYTLLDNLSDKHMDYPVKVLIDCIIDAYYEMATSGMYSDSPVDDDPFWADWQPPTYDQADIPRTQEPVREETTDSDAVDTPFLLSAHNNRDPDIIIPGLDISLGPDGMATSVIVQDGTGLEASYLVLDNPVATPVEAHPAIDTSGSAMAAHNDSTDTSPISSVSSSLYDDEDTPRATFLDVSVDTADIPHEPIVQPPKVSYCDIGTDASPPVVHEDRAIDTSDLVPEIRSVDVAVDATVVETLEVKPAIECVDVAVDATVEAIESVDVAIDATVEAIESVGVAIDATVETIESVDVAIDATVETTVIENVDVAIDATTVETSQLKPVTEEISVQTEDLTSTPIPQNADIVQMEAPAATPENDIGDAMEASYMMIDDERYNAPTNVPDLAHNEQLDLGALSEVSSSATDISGPSELETGNDTAELTFVESEASMETRSLDGLPSTAAVADVTPAPGSPIANAAVIEAQDSEPVSTNLDGAPEPVVPGTSEVADHLLDENAAPTLGTFVDGSDSVQDNPIEQQPMQDDSEVVGEAAVDGAEDVSGDGMDASYLLVDDYIPTEDNSKVNGTDDAASAGLVAESGNNVEELPTDIFEFTPADDMKASDAVLENEDVVSTGGKTLEIVQDPLVQDPLDNKDSVVEGSEPNLQDNSATTVALPATEMTNETNLLGPEVIEGLSALANPEGDAVAAIEGSSTEDLVGVNGDQKTADVVADSSAAELVGLFQEKAHEEDGKAMEQSME
ncbi:hypothetical protein EW026_g213 [Hermanssonia centrifuga]|uniref:Uncharacterized protein n=1 Tax=Hermanssonia centrifuga TaxID=98765 RepID=A0A4S4KWX3_9APHY|nr:hypothetical protein EW026_g213 [Hermanssonia centrifuga]